MNLFFYARRGGFPWRPSKSDFKDHATQRKLEVPEFDIGEVHLSENVNETRCRSTGSKLTVHVEVFDGGWGRRLAKPKALNVLTQHVRPSGEGRPFKC